MAAGVAAYGTGERPPEGTLVFKQGARSADFFLVLAGGIAIFDRERKPDVFTAGSEASRR